MGETHLASTGGGSKPKGKNTAGFNPRNQTFSRRKLAQNETETETKGLQGRDGTAREGAHPVSLQAPLHGAANTLQRLAALSYHGTEGRLFIILPVGKDPHNDP